MFTFMSLVLGGFCESVAGTLAKKSLQLSHLPSALFKLLGGVSAIILLPILIYIFGFDVYIFEHLGHIVIIAGLMCARIVHVYLHLHILRNTKVSQLIPYQNLGKLLIIIAGFFIFYGTPQGASWITLIISFITLGVIFAGNIKNLEVPRKLWLIIIDKLITAGVFLGLAYLVTLYSPITMTSINWLFQSGLLICVALLLGNNFKDIFKQTRTFYTYRFIGSTCGWGNTFISLFILEQVGVIVATLVGFLSLVFKVISMKYILHDTPTKRQIIMALTVMVLIGIGYYFK